MLFRSGTHLPRTDSHVSLRATRRNRGSGRILSLGRRKLYNGPNVIRRRRRVDRQSRFVTSVPGMHVYKGFDAQSCSEGPFEQSRSSSAGKAGLRRDLRLLETRRATEHLRKLQSRMVFEKRDAPFRHVQATERVDLLENGHLRETIDAIRRPAVLNLRSSSKHSVMTAARMAPHATTVRGTPN